MFDWDDDAINQKKYGQSSPPFIDITEISGNIPIGMCVGIQDTLGDIVDGRWARDQL